MKILQILHNFPPFNVAGTEVYTYNLSFNLAQRYKVFVFHRISDLRTKEYMLTHNNLNGLEIFTINNTFRMYDSFTMTYKNDVIAKKFSYIIDQIKPDIVHIQHLLYLSASIIEEVKRRGIPIVFTLHDYWLMCPQGQLFKNNNFVCEAKNYAECVDCILYLLSIEKHALKAYHQLRKFLPETLFQIIKNIYLSCCRMEFLFRDKITGLLKARTAYMKNICTKVDLFICPSLFLRKKFIDFGIPENKIVYLTYGFHSDNLKKFEKSLSNKIRFGFVGNLLPAKGVHILIESFNKIKNDNAELRIYGGVSSYKGILANYLKYLKKITKNKNIRFMGSFENDKIANIFAEIDILVVPSIWYENSPLVIQEAFIARTPVIASRIGGIPELVNDGMNGLLFNPGDANDLKEKMQYIIQNKGAIEKFIEYMPGIKSIEENAKEIEEIYSKLIT